MRPQGGEKSCGVGKGSNLLRNGGRIVEGKKRYPRLYFIERKESGCKKKASSIDGAKKKGSLKIQLPKGRETLKKNTKKSFKTSKGGGKGELRLRGAPGK